MIGDFIKDRTRNLLGFGNGPRKTDASIAQISRHASKLLGLGVQLLSAAPQNLGRLNKKITAEAQNLRVRVDQHNSEASRASPELGDALRVFFRPGPAQVDAARLLRQAMPEGDLGFYVTCITSGDRKQLAELTQLASLSHASLSEMQSIIARMTTMHDQAVTKAFAREASRTIARCRKMAHGSSHQDRMVDSPPEHLSQSSGSNSWIYDKGPPTPPAVSQYQAQGYFADPPRLPSFGSSLTDRLHLWTPSSETSEDAPSSSESSSILGFEIHRGEKVKNISANGAKPYYSVLYSEALPKPLMLTNSIVHGGFGSLRLAMNEDQQLYAIKEFRTFDPRMPPSKERSVRQQIVMSRKKTWPMHSAQVLAEARTTQKMRDMIELGCAKYDSVDAPNNNSLRAVRTAVNPFMIHDLVGLEPQNNVAKVHMIMTAEDGDLFDLAYKVPLQYRPALSLSVAAQGFTELSALHQQKVLHLDLKVENLLFHRDGQIKLMDFGLTVELGRKKSFDVDGIYGTVFAPEFLPDGSSGPGKRRLTTATDVWGMAICIVDAADLQTSSIFNFSEISPRANSESAKWRAAKVFIDEFAFWRNNLPRTPQGQIDVTAIDRSTKFGNYFRPLARDNPALCTLLLEHALQLNPAKRWPASRLAREVRSLLAPNTAALSALRAEMTRQAEANEVVRQLRVLPKKNL